MTIFSYVCRGGLLLLVVVLQPREVVIVMLPAGLKDLVANGVVSLLARGQMVVLGGEGGCVVYCWATGVLHVLSYLTCGMVALCNIIMMLWIRHQGVGWGNPVVLVVCYIWGICSDVICKLDRCWS